MNVAWFQDEQIARIQRNVAVFGMMYAAAAANQNRFAEFVVMRWYIMIYRRYMLYAHRGTGANANNFLVYRMAYLHADEHDRISDLFKFLHLRIQAIRLLLVTIPA